MGIGRQGNGTREPAVVLCVFVSVPAAATDSTPVSRVLCLPYRASERLNRILILYVLFISLSYIN